MSGKTVQGLQLGDIMVTNCQSLDVLHLLNLLPVIESYRSSKIFFLKNDFTYPSRRWSVGPQSCGGHREDDPIPRALKKDQEEEELVCSGCWGLSLSS